MPKGRDDSKVVCHGTVVDRSGNAVDGVEMRIYRPTLHSDARIVLSSSHIMDESRSDPHGGFSFSIDSTGLNGLDNSAIVVASKNGYAIAWALWDVQKDIQQQIVLREAVKATGVVRDGSGNPVVGARVQAVLKPADSAGKSDQVSISIPDMLTTVSDMSGRFVFENMAPDAELDFICTAQGYLEMDTSEERFRHVRFNTRRPAELFLIKPALVTGQVIREDTSRPQADLKVKLMARAYPDAVREVQVCDVDVQGRFRFECRPQEYEIAVVSNEQEPVGWVSSPLRVYARSGSQKETTLKIWPAKAIQIEVRDLTKGAPVAELPLAATPTRIDPVFYPSQIKTGPDGTVHVRLPVGGCRFLVHGFDYQTFPDKRGAVYYITSNSPTAIQLTVRHRMTRRVSGRVTDYSQRAIAGVPVKQLFIERQRATNTYQTSIVNQCVSDPNGFFEMYVRRPRGNMSFEDRAFVLVAQKDNSCVGYALWHEITDVERIIEIDEPKLLAGTVTDAQGNPIADASVRLSPGERVGVRKDIQFHRILAHTEWFSMITDADGRFKFDKIPGDALIQMTVEADGYYRHFLADDRRSQPFAADRNDIAVVLHEPSVITGVVRDTAGSPVPEISLSFSRMNNDGLRSHISGNRTEKDGTFQVECMFGTYKMFLADKDAKERNLTSVPVEVVVAEDSPAETELLVSSGEIVKVRVLDVDGLRTMEGISISLKPDHGGSTAWAKSDSSGIAHIRAATGSYRLRAQYGYQLLTDNAEVIVQPGQSGIVEVLVADKFTTTAIVRNEEGAPLIGAEVRRLPDRQLLAVTDQTGRFWFKWADEKRPNFFIEIVHEQTDTANVKRLYWRDLVLNPRLTITGRLVDENDQPVSEPRLVIYPGDGVSNPTGEPYFDGPVRLDSAGSFQVGHLMYHTMIGSEVRYFVEATAPGYGRIGRKVLMRRNSVVDELVDIGTIKLPAGSLSISGHVIDMNGRVVPGAEVEIRLGNEGIEPVIADHSGAFVFENLPIQIQRRFLGKYEAEVTLEANAYGHSTGLMEVSAGEQSAYIIIEPKRLLSAAEAEPLLAHQKAEGLSLWDRRATARVSVLSSPDGRYVYQTDYKTTQADLSSPIPSGMARVVFTVANTQTGQGVENATFSVMLLTGPSGRYSDRSSFKLFTNSDGITAMTVPAEYFSIYNLSHKSFNTLRFNEQFKVELNKVNEFDFRLEPAPELVVSVFDTNDTPVSGAELQLYPPGDPERLDVVEIETGKYKLSWDMKDVRPEDSRIVLVTRDKRRSLAALSEVARDAKELKVDLEKTATLKGKFLDSNGEAMRNSIVNVSMLGPGENSLERNRQLQCETDGSYIVTGLVPHCSHVLYFSSHNNMRNRRIRIKPDQMLPGVIKTVDCRYIEGDLSVSGKLVDQNGRPVFAYIVADGPSQPTRNGMAAPPDGRFVIDGLVEGPVTLTVIDRNRPDFVSSQKIQTEAGRSDLEIVVERRRPNRGGR